MGPMSRTIFYIFCVCYVIISLIVRYTKNVLLSNAPPNLSQSDIILFAMQIHNNKNNSDPRYNLLIYLIWVSHISVIFWLLILGTCWSIADDTTNTVHSTNVNTA